MTSPAGVGRPRTSLAGLVVVVPAITMLLDEPHAAYLAGGSNLVDLMKPC